MKKVMVSLLVLGLMLITPLSVLAEVKVVPSIPNDPSSESENDSGLVKVFPIYVELTGDEGETFTDNSFKFEFEFGPAIQNFACDDYGDYTATAEGDVGSGATCTFASEAEATIGKVQVGTISVLVDKNASDSDCTIKYMLGEASATFNKPNPNTGATIPYEIILGGLALAAGAYVVASKKTKLYKI